MMRLGDRFVLLREVGSGVTSTVFLGRDELLDRPVAVKVLKSDLEGSRIGARFRREGINAARLSHPNIGQVFDAGEDVLDGREVSYVVTEYLPGGDLRHLVELHGRLTEAMISRIGTDIADGLAYAHERGTIHRAVTPENILFDAQGIPKLVDFGLASEPQRTYSSPERLRGVKAKPADDVYSLGVALYEAATGKLPDGATPREHGAAIGEFHEAIIMSCLSEDPAARPDAARLRSLFLGTDMQETGPSWSNRAGGTLKTLGAAGVAGASRTARTLGTAGAAGTGRLGGAVRSAAARRRERNESDEPGGVETVFVGDRTFASGLDRRVILLAAAVLVLLLVLTWAAISALNSGESANNTAGEKAGQKKSEEGDRNSGGSGGGETTPETTAQEASAPAPPVDTADDVVFNMYVMATEGDYEGSWNLLSSRYQKEEVGSLEEWQARQSSLTNLIVTREFVAKPDGENQAKVSFETQETRDGVVQTVSGVWTCTNEDGEWKLDRFVEQ